MTSPLYEQLEEIGQQHLGAWVGHFTTRHPAALGQGRRTGDRRVGLVSLVRLVLQTRELVAFLLERYAQRREKNDRIREYEAYYASRSEEEELEEADLLEDFAQADADAAGGHSGSDFSRRENFR